MAKKETKKAVKLVKITANSNFNIDKTKEGTLRLWGIDFAVKKGIMTAEIDADIAGPMIDAGLVK